MLLPFQFRVFFFFHSVQKAMEYKNCYRIFLNFIEKKSEGKNACEELLCAENIMGTCSPQVRDERDEIKCSLSLGRA